MTKYKGRSTRKLPDMSIPPAELPEYKPPVGGEVMEYPVDLGDGHNLLIRQVIYRGMTVDFAIMQFHEIEGESRQIARIDCCHGSVHRHVMSRSGDDSIDGDVIQEIAVDQNPWSIVDGQFEPCLDKMQNEFLENYRRWEK